MNCFDSNIFLMITESDEKPVMVNLNHVIIIERNVRHDVLWVSNGKLHNYRPTNMVLTDNFIHIPKDEQEESSCEMWLNLDYVVNMTASGIKTSTYDTIRYEFNIRGLNRAIITYVDLKTYAPQFYKLYNSQLVLSELSKGE